MACIEIAGKSFPLRFDMGALEFVEEVFGSFDEMQKQLRAGKVTAIINVTYIMALSHAESEGRELKESRSWFAHHIGPKDLAQVAKGIGDALNEGMSTQEEELDPYDGDVLLAENQKKSQEA